MAGYIHHTITQSRPDKDPNSSYYEYRPKGCSLSTDSRVQEVNSIITHPYKEVNDGENSQEN